MQKKWKKICTIQIFDLSLHRNQNNNIMKTLLNRKQLLSELYKLQSAESISLTIFQKGIEVSCKMLTFDAIRLVQMLPYKTTTYYYEKVSDLAK